MRWRLTHSCDPIGRRLADRHYNRHSEGASHFLPPGKRFALVTLAGNAVWGSVWQKEEVIDHAWPGCWYCSIFRNESPILSSLLIVEAVAATRAVWGEPPPNGYITFVNAKKVKKKRDPGRCFRRAGFREVGRTKDVGLIVLQLDVGDMPEPESPIFQQQELWS